MPRRFNSSETVRAFLQSEHPMATPQLKKSLKLFVEVLEDFRDDERFSTATGIVKLKDQFEEKQVIWRLNVKKSIADSFYDDKHISLTAIGEPETGQKREKDVCVEKKGKLPIGDYLAQFLLLFANGKHMAEIKTLATAAMRVTYPNRPYSRIDPLQVHWQPFYEIAIAQAATPDVRVTALLALEPEHRLYIVRRLFNLDLDFEPSITHDELQILFLDTFERCESVDVKRFIVARLTATEETLSRILLARDAGHDDEHLQRAIEYAINRMHGSIE